MKVEALQVQVTCPEKEGDTELGREQGESVNVRPNLRSGPQIAEQVNANCNLGSQPQIWKDGNCEEESQYY